MARSVAGRSDYTYMAGMSFGVESIATDSSGASEVDHLKSYSNKK